MGRNGNDKMHPIAWVVVVAENIDSWVWFFIELQNCLGLDKGDEYLKYLPYLYVLIIFL